MIEKIFDTPLKVRIAKLFARTHEELHVSAVAERIKSSKSQASKCLQELEDAGVLSSKRAGNLVIYRLKENEFARAVVGSLFPENILLENIKKDIVRTFKPLNPLSVAVFGSATKGLKLGSDVDIFIIFGKRYSRKDLARISADLTAKYGVRVSPFPISLAEFRTKTHGGEEFMINVLASHQHLYGTDMEALVW